MRTTYRIEGLKEVKKALEELPKATGTNVLKRALTIAGAPIAAAAKSLAPDDPRTSGFDLEQSIVVSQKLSRRQKSQHVKESKVEVFVGAGPLAQATQQEFGNVNHGPQPFLRPAWDAGRMPALNTIKAILWAEIDKAAKRLAAKAARIKAKAALG